MIVRLKSRVARCSGSTIRGSGRERTADDSADLQTLARYPTRGRGAMGRRPTTNDGNPHRYPSRRLQPALTPRRADGQSPDHALAVAINPREAQRQPAGFCRDDEYPDSDRRELGARAEKAHRCGVAPARHCTQTSRGIGRRLKKPISKPESARPTAAPLRPCPPHGERSPGSSANPTAESRPPAQTSGPLRSPSRQRPRTSA